MIKRLANWGGYVGLVVLAAAATLPFVRPELYRLRWTLVIAGVLLVLASLVARIEDFRGFVGRRTVRYGVNTAVALLLVLGATVVVQALSSRHSTRWDLTENKRFSLSPQTIQLLGGLKTDESATVPTVPTSDEDESSRLILKLYPSTGSSRTPTLMPSRSPAIPTRLGSP